MGKHVFSYLAVDSFKNKAKCSFTVLVIDQTPPVIDNCIDPNEYLIPSCSTNSSIDKNLCYIEWDDPIIYDNSNAELMVHQSLYPGYLNVGTHNVKYIAHDQSGNEMICVMHIKVKQLQCEILASPLNGHTICAKNTTHTWCDVTCDDGYAIYDELADSHLEHFTLNCENNFAKWKYEIIPDCTVMELFNSVEQIFSITLDAEKTICNDEKITEKVNFCYKNIL